MPPERNPRTQSSRFAPNDQASRPSRQSSIRNYANIERIDEPIANPLRASTTRQPQEPLRERALSPLEASPEVEQDDPFADRAAEIPAIPTTVILRRVPTAKPVKEVEEATWTRDHFDITLLEGTYIRTWRKDKAEYQDRKWSCKYCTTWSTTDAKRHGSTTNLATHLRTVHYLTEERALQGLLPSKVSTNSRAMASFLAESRPLLSPEEGMFSHLLKC